MFKLKLYISDFFLCSAALMHIQKIPLENEKPRDVFIAKVLNLPLLNNLTDCIVLKQTQLRWGYGRIDETNILMAYK